MSIAEYGERQTQRHELVWQRLVESRSDMETWTIMGSCDAVLSLLVGKRDVTGETRIRERDRDRGYTLAGASTLNRREPGEPEQAANGRYQHIVPRPQGFDELLVDDELAATAPGEHTHDEWTSPTKPTPRDTAELPPPNDNYLKSTTAPIAMQ